MTINLNRLKKVGNFLSGHIGSVADGAPRYARTYSAELTASQDMKAGNVLILGTDPSSQVRPTILGDTLTYQTFAGFMLLDPTKEAADSTGVQYADGDAVAVLKFGVMNVSASEAVTAGEAVVVQVNGGTLKGEPYTGSLATGEYRIPNAVWLDSVSAGGVGQISLGMGNGALSFSVVGAVSASNI